MRTSEPIKLRWKKIGNGKEAAFLDITVPDRPRKKEYLRIYRGGGLPRSKSRENEKLAQAICQRRLNDYNAARAGMRVARAHRLLLDYYDECCHNPSFAENTRLSWLSSMIHLKNYVARRGLPPNDLTVGDIDGEWCKGYLKYLQRDAKPLLTYDTSARLKPSSARLIFSKFKACLSRAVQDGIIYHNPTQAVGWIRSDIARREYLDADEVRTLMQTPYTNDTICRAFLFSCLTGLRYSDIRQLRWDMVKRFDGRYRIDFSQKKTKGQMYLDISDLAFAYMGEGSGLVFKGLPRNSAYNEPIERWIKSAGIEKHITFHCARHTAAVSLLTAGVEIYTVSKILGHASLSTTQIYADIVDGKRRDAIDALADLIGDSQGTKR